MTGIPFADPLWLTRGESPYYGESHRRLQKEVRAYVDEHIAPFCDEWERKGAVPQEVFHPLLNALLNLLISFRSSNGTQSLDTPLWLPTQ
jgi:hypothetical protein